MSAAPLTGLTLVTVTQPLFTKASQNTASPAVPRPAKFQRLPPAAVLLDHWPSPPTTRPESLMP